MAAPSRRTPDALAVGLLGLGVALFGVAFAVRPVHASGTVFWGLIMIAVVATVFGVIFLRRDNRLRPGLLARECRQLENALETLVRECPPRSSGRFGGAAGRRESATLARYQSEFRGWANQIFDQAVAAGAILPACRPLLQAESVVQLRALCSRFADAAEELERR